MHTTESINNKSFEKADKSDFDYSDLINAIRDAIYAEYGDNPPIKIDWDFVKKKGRVLLGLSITN